MTKTVDVRRSNLLLNALIFIVKAIIGTGTRVSRKKAHHLILVEVHRADVGFIILVVVIEYAALAVCRAFFIALRHRVHAPFPVSKSIIQKEEKKVKPFFKK